jgi:hypothetical protein
MPKLLIGDYAESPLGRPKQAKHIYAESALKSPSEEQGRGIAFKSPTRPGFGRIGTEWPARAAGHERTAASAQKRRNA